MIILFALLLASPQATPPAAPDRFSILAQNCPKSGSDEVVVCAPVDGQRLPLPEERGPKGDPRAGLDNAGNGACVTSSCEVGVNLIGAGVAAVRLVGKLIDPDSCCEPGQATDPVALAGDVGRAFRKKPDKSNRVAIPLDDPSPPSVAGRLLR